MLYLVAPQRRSVLEETSTSGATTARCNEACGDGGGVVWGKGGVLWDAVGRGYSFVAVEMGRGCVG